MQKVSNQEPIARDCPEECIKEHKEGFEKISNFDYFFLFFVKKQIKPKPHSPATNICSTISNKLGMVSFLKKKNW